MKSAFWLDVIAVDAPSLAPRIGPNGVFGRDNGREAVQAMERDGRPGLHKYFQHLEQETETRGFLLDEEGEDVSGQPAPPDVRGLAARANETGDTEVHRSDMGALRAKLVIGADENRYVFVSQLRRGPLGPFSRPPARLALHLILSAIAAGIVAYFLARYVTDPVRKLRAVTQRLADGDLATRIGAPLENRKDVIGDLGRDFDFMAARIESLVSVQQRLLRDVSHELRSPLARLNVALGLAAQRAAPETLGALDRIEREAERLNELIGQLLSLTRLESGTEGIEKTTIDLAGLVREIAADADFEARSRKRRVRVVACEGCTVVGKAELLRSALENVVRNAVRYTAEGTEVQISLRCRCDADNTYVAVCVRDHGPGVPEAALVEVFRPFHRVGDARDRQSGGTGLGLAITERAIGLHSGTVSAANAPDGGLVVEIHLPQVRHND